VISAELFSRNNYFINIAALFFDKAGTLRTVEPVPTGRAFDRHLIGRWEPPYVLGITQSAQTRMGWISSVSVNTRLKAAKSSSSSNKRIRPTPRFSTWKTVPPGATREVLGIKTCYAKPSTK